MIEPTQYDDAKRHLRYLVQSKSFNSAKNLLNGVAVFLRFLPLSYQIVQSVQLASHQLVGQGCVSSKTFECSISTKGDC